MSRILMHICCAPDATVGYERLAKYGDVWGLFYNPNIEPLGEYDHRLRECVKFTQSTKERFIELQPDRNAWQDAVAGLGNEPERGERCQRCIRHNLEKAALRSLEMDISEFTTTLTASPYKDVAYIHKTGNDIARKLGLIYIDETLRKQNGYMRSLELTSKFDLYRQNYCGCRWSLRDRKMKSRTMVEELTD